MFRTIFIALLCSILFLLVPLCSYASGAPDMEIIVKKGDTLSGICNKYLASPRQWKKIAQVNRLANPDFISPGQKLLFPVHLLKGIPMNGNVTFVKGKVSVQEQGSTLWRTLLLHDTVKQGSTLATGEEGAVEVTFEDGASFLLSPSTSLKISAAERKSSGYFLRELYLRAGRALSDLREATGKASRFEIQTPSAVAATRGTAFRVSVDTTESTRSEVLHGKIGIEAMKQTVTVSEGEGTFVKKGEPPMEPKRLLPSPTALNVLPVYKSTPLHFRFSKIKDAVSYRVLLAKDTGMKDIIREQVIRPEDTFTLYTVDDGTYFLQARSIDNIGLEGISAAPTAIKIRMNPLPPLIESPVDNAVYTTNSPIFKWLGVSDAVRYQAEVAEDKEFRKIINTAADIRDLEYKTGPLASKTYFFRVRSIARDGYEGDWSDMLRFTIAPPSPIRPELPPK